MFHYIIEYIVHLYFQVLKASVTLNLPQIINRHTNPNNFCLISQHFNMVTSMDTLNFQCILFYENSTINLMHDQCRTNKHENVFIYRKHLSKTNTDSILIVTDKVVALLCCRQNYSRCMQGHCWNHIYLRGRILSWYPKKGRLIGKLTSITFFIFQIVKINIQYISQVAGENQK